MGEAGPCWSPRAVARVEMVMRWLRGVLRHDSRRRGVEHGGVGRSRRRRQLWNAGRRHWLVVQGRGGDGTRRRLRGIDAGGGVGVIMLSGGCVPGVVVRHRGGGWRVLVVRGRITRGVGADFVVGRGCQVVRGGHQLVVGRLRVVVLGVWGVLRRRRVLRDVVRRRRVLRLVGGERRHLRRHDARGQRRRRWRHLGAARASRRPRGGGDQ